MTPLFVYRRGDQFLIRELDDHMDDLPPKYKLVASIDARTWLQFYLNYGATDRRRMLKEIRGGK